jgi:hypothetical protein
MLHLSLPRAARSHHPAAVLQGTCTDAESLFRDLVEDTGKVLQEYEEDVKFRLIFANVGSRV